MKRKAEMNGAYEYDLALKRVSLVERNRHPDGTSILNLNTISMHEPSDIIGLASQIQHADVSIKNNACGKLTVILEQIKFLQAQAKRILEESSKHSNLHHVACNFQKIPGNIYHLYNRNSGQKYFSMLSPQDWGPSLKHEYLGSYRLEYDQSWTTIDKIEEINNAQEWASKLFDASRNNQTLLPINKITEMELS